MYLNDPNLLRSACFRRNNQPLIASLIILAFLFNALTPLVASAHADRQVGGKVLLCTSLGYRWVDLDDQNRSEVSKPHCVFCFGHDSDDIDTLSQQGAIVGYGFYRVKQQSQDVLIKPFNDGLAFPRGPPLL